MNNEASQSREQTKKCPKCGEEILMSAKKCKHCQADLRNWFARHKAITGGIIVFILFLVIVSSDNDKKLEEVKKSTELLEEANEQVEKKLEELPDGKEEEIYKSNEDATIDDLKIRVIKVKDLGNSIKQSFGNPITTQGTFIRVDFEVENLGNEGQYMGDMKIVDSKNREFGESDKKYSILGDDANFLDKLNPNVKTNYSSVFDIAPDAEGLKLKTNGFGLFNSDYILIDLGI